MKIDDITRQSLLYDFYGALLTQRQSQVMKLYHEENLSLAEIAEELKISRQGVYDALKKAENSLKAYEKKLGLIERFGSTRDVIEEIDARIQGLIVKMEAAASEETGKTAFASELKDIRRVLDKLEE
ncbi:MAG: YlxM family DNA-binding protein [Eubacteriales bacterium]|nr:YlxM family DNA-binding protein [Eubacteriales bacterium]